MMTIEEIKEILPHRFPFLLVDRVSGFDLENKTITCLKNVTANEPFFQGHFPDHPVMPGMLIIEALAQAAGILGFQLAQPDPGDASIYYFAAADKLRFRRPVVPGDQLVLVADYVSHKRNLWKFSCQAFVEGNVVCSAEVMCARKEP